MSRWFNIAGPCKADKHYMLSPTSRLPNLEHSNFRGAQITPFEHAILIGADFRGATPALHDMICRGMNVIWDTIMFDGTIQRGPYFGEWKSISK